MRGGSSDPWGGPRPGGVQDRPLGGCRQPPSAHWGTHTWSTPQGPGPRGPYGAGLGVPPREPRAAGTWAWGPPWGLRPSGVGQTYPLDAAWGGRALARPPSRRQGGAGGPCVHEKCFSARPEGKLRLFWSARAGARVANRWSASVCSSPFPFPPPTCAPYIAPFAGFYKYLRSCLRFLKNPHLGGDPPEPRTPRGRRASHNQG